MEIIVITANAGKLRFVEANGRQFAVADISILVHGVLEGSKGALYYPPEEIGKDYESWNGMPMVVYHPSLNGNNVSARSPDIMIKQEVGRIYNTQLDSDSTLRAEGWFDTELTRKVDSRVWNALINGDPIEVSTGLFTDNEPAPEGSNFRGKPYQYIARNYRPDHLAILPDQIGACSIKDGCGVFNKSSDDTIDNADCGTGAGGFKPGNTCAKSDGPSSIELPKGVEVGPKTGKTIEADGHRFNREGLQKAGDVFWSREKDYAESFMEEVGKKGEIVSAKVKLTNPLHIVVSKPGQFSDPSFENPIIKKAKEAGHDGVIFQKKDDSDEFYVVFGGKHTANILTNELIINLVTNPSWVKDHTKWDKAKEIAQKEGRGDDYAYITGIYKKMGGEMSSNTDNADCGTGAGGFHPGNTCASGDGSSSDGTKVEHYSIGSKVSDPDTSDKGKIVRKTDRAVWVHWEGGDEDFPLKYTKDDLKEGKLKLNLLTNSSGDNMDRTKLISWLTTNCDCYKGKPDSEAKLKALTDNEFKAVLMQNAEKAIDNEDTKFFEWMMNAGDDVKSSFVKLMKKNMMGKMKPDETMPAMTPEEIAKKKAEEEAKKAQATQYNNTQTTIPTGNMTKEQYLASLPTDIREIITNAEKITNNGKKEIVTKLVANISDTVEQAKMAQRLMSKSMSDLEDMLALMPKPQVVQQQTNNTFKGYDFWGHQGTTDNAQKEREELQKEVIEDPVYNWAEWSKK